MNPTNLDRLITDALAIEAQDAKEAGALGYMARALVQATLPHSKPDGNEFERRNGAFTLVRSNSNKGTQSPTGRFGVSARQCPGLALVRNSLIGAAHLIPSARAVSYEPWAPIPTTVVGRPLALPQLTPKSD